MNNKKEITGKSFMDQEEVEFYEKLSSLLAVENRAQARLLHAQKERLSFLEKNQKFVSRSPILAGLYPHLINSSIKDAEGAAVVSSILSDN